MSYEQIKDLRPALFKRYCGVRPETFDKMVAVISDHLGATRIKSGRPPKLSIEDQVLMTLEYWREYRTFFHIARSWGLHESTVWRTIKAGGRPVNQEQGFHLARQKAASTLRPRD
jgi:hypothetical protein